METGDGLGKADWMLEACKCLSIGVVGCNECMVRFVIVIKCNLLYIKIFSLYVLHLIH